MKNQTVRAKLFDLIPNVVSPKIIKFYIKRKETLNAASRLLEQVEHFSLCFKIWRLLRQKYNLHSTRKEIRLCII